MSSVKDEPVCSLEGADVSLNHPYAFFCLGPLILATVLGIVQEVRGQQHVQTMGQ